MNCTLTPASLQHQPMQENEGREEAPSNPQRVIHRGHVVSNYSTDERGEIVHVSSTFRVSVMPGCEHPTRPDDIGWENQSFASIDRATREIDSEIGMGVNP